MKTAWIQDNGYLTYRERLLHHGAVAAVIPNRVLAHPEAGDHVRRFVVEEGIQVLPYLRDAHGITRRQPGLGYWTELMEYSYVRALGAFTQTVAQPRVDPADSLCWYSRERMGVREHARLMGLLMCGQDDFGPFLLDHLSLDPEYVTWQVRSVWQAHADFGLTQPIIWNGRSSTVLQQPDCGAMLESMGKLWSDSDDAMELAVLVSQFDRGAPLVLDCYRRPQLVQLAYAIAAQRDPGSTYVLHGRVKGDALWVSEDTWVPLGATA